MQSNKQDMSAVRGLQLTGGIPATVAKIIYSKKFVINYGYDYANYAKIECRKLHSLLYGFIEKPILTLANKVIITSKEFKSIPCSAAKIAYIPNGVDTHLFSQKSRVTQKKHLNIIYLGRLEKQKNLSTLIKAVSQTKNTIKLIFYGKGSQKSQLLNLAKQLKVNLKIKPPIDYQKVPKILKEADIFVLPSKEEGHPKALIEAMAAGLAVIGADVKGIRQLISHSQTGILTDTSATQISKAIHSLRDAKTRSKLGQAARRFVLKNFDIERLLNKEVSLLLKVANEKEKIAICL